MQCVYLTNLLNDGPESAATLLHLAHITELASGGTADVVAVAIKK